MQELLPQLKIRVKMKRRKNKGKKYISKIAYRVTVEMKMEFVDKVKKLTNEGLTQMVAHI